MDNLCIILCFALCLPLRALSLELLTGEVLSDLLNASFPGQNLSSYTIRYLSQSSGNDTETCLNGTYPQSCNSVGYSLTGKLSGRGSDIHNLILLVSPGEYSLLSDGVRVRDSSNIIIMAPHGPGDIVFMCDSSSTRLFKNLYFENVTNIALVGITFTNCGP